MRIDRPAGAGPALRREALLPRLLRLIIAIIALAAIACCCGLRSLPAQEGRHFAGGGFAAIANGEPITVFELEEALQQQLATMQQQIPPEALKEARRKLRAQVLDHLILRKLLLQHCDRKKIEVHPQEVEGWVQQRVQQLQEEGYGIQDAADFFRGWKESTGESEEEARKSIADEMRIGRLVRSQIQREEYVSPAEMRSFYRAHPEMFTSEESYTFLHVLVPRDDPDLQEILKELEGALAAGEPSFEELVRRYSKGPRAADGGRWVRTDRQLESWRSPLPETIRALSPGEVSARVDRPAGIHYLKLEERVTGRLLSFIEAQELIRRQIEEQRRRQQQERFEKELREGAQIRKFIEE